MFFDLSKRTKLKIGLNFGESNQNSILPSAENSFDLVENVKAIPFGPNVFKEFKKPPVSIFNLPIEHR